MAAGQAREKPMPDPASTGQTGSRFGVVGMVTLIGSAFIGFNTLVTSCASENVASNAARLHAIEEEERFWTDAMRDLADLTKDKDVPGSNYEVRCAFLASRTAPFIAEFTDRNAELERQDADPRIGDGPDDRNITDETRELERRVRMLRDEFVRSIGSDAVTPDCNAAYEAALDRAQTDRAAKARAKVGLPDRQPDDVASQARAPLPPREPLFALSGLSRKGWDIDVFWCEDAAEEATNANFASAYDFGTKLAEFANDGKQLEHAGKAYEIGRVRVRRLAATLWQNQSEYSGVNGTDVVRFGPAEDGEADLARALSGKTFGSMLVPQEAPGTSTPWYLSAFFCSANTGSAAAPDESAAAL